MSRTSPGRRPSPPSTKPRRRTTQHSRANTRPTSLCTTRSRGMTGSLGPCGQHPRSVHRSWAHPAGRALQPEAARRCTPHRPCVCTPWPTGLRYESVSAGQPRWHLLCAGALGSLSAFPRLHVLDEGKSDPGHGWPLAETRDQGSS